MLDFNDITMDDQGRVYVAYTDGCTGSCVSDKTRLNPSDVDMVMRLQAGKGLIAKYDGKLGKVPHGVNGTTTSVVFMLPLASTALVARRRRNP